jgi:hypothetical protein
VLCFPKYDKINKYLATEDFLIYSRKAMISTAFIEKQKIRECFRNNHYSLNYLEITFGADFIVLPNTK